MSETDLIEALLLRKPYFGSALRALQGVATRHKYMGAVVQYLADQTLQHPVKILEIGSWAGASAVTWARALTTFFDQGEVLCIDPWEPFIDVAKNNDRHYFEMERYLENGSIFELFLHNIKACGVSDNIRYLKGRSDDLLPGLNRNDYTIVYIDGAHHYEGVLSDLRNSLSLVRDGGVICGDDLELQMHQVKAADLQSDVESGSDYLEERFTGTAYHPGVTQAVGEMFGEVSEWEGFWAVKKMKGSWVKLDVTPCKTEIPDHLLPFTQTAANDFKASLNSYNVVRFQERLIAISKNIGNVDPSERIGNCEIFPLILAGNTIEELKEKIEKAETSILGSHLELVEQTECYNYIQMGQRLFAVSTALGPVDLKTPIGMMDFPPYILQGETPEEVRDKVQHYSALRKNTHPK